MSVKGSRAKLISAGERIDRFGRDERGAMAVEFAIIAPVLILGLFLVLEIGRYFWTLSNLNYAVELVLREAAVQRNLPATEIEQRLRNRLRPTIGDGVTMQVSYAAASGAMPRLLSIDVSYSLVAIGPFSSVSLPMNTSGRAPIIDLP